MDYNEYDYSSQQWDVDRVKLEFKSVSDLLALIKKSDFQVYKETAAVHRELREELNTIPVNSQSSTFISSTTSSSSSPTTQVSSPKILSENNSSFLLPVNVGDNLLSLYNYLCVDNCHILVGVSIIFCVIVIASVFSIIILCKKNRNYNIKSSHVVVGGRASGGDVQSSYVKSSISLDDIPPTTSHVDHPPSSLPQDLSSPVSLLQNSPFYSPSQGAASFTTFHPHHHLRTSPEGSSSSDHDFETEGKQAKFSKHSNIVIINNPVKEDIYAKVNKLKQARNNNVDANFVEENCHNTVTSDTSECLI